MTPGRGQPGQLRVLVVNWLDRENPRAGGAETHLHELFGRLAAKGHSVSALVSGWAGCRRRVTLDGIDVHRTGTRYTFSFAAPVHYRRRLSSIPFDVVIEDLNKVPVFSPLWAAEPVVLLVHHLFGSTAFRAGPWPLAAATWALERPVPFVFRESPTVAVSESTKEDLVGRGMRRDRIRIIPNGIDLAFFTPARDPSPRGSPSILYLGRLRRYKRVDLILDAMGILAGRGVEVELRIAGDGEMRGSLSAQVRRMGLEGRVHFLGSVSEVEKRDELRRAWVHVLTSPKEGWGITNLEAAACGTPTVASDSPGLRESVVDGESGVLVPHGDVPALADALERLVSDPKRLAQLGRGARAFAERFSWESSASTMEAFLQRVVGESGRH